MTSQSALTAKIIDTAQHLSARGFSPANTGSYSARLDNNSILISTSSKDDANMTADDILLMDLAGHAQKAAANAKPSKEALLHTQLYSLDRNIGAVLHSQSIAASVLSKLAQGDRLTVRGYGIQEALIGNGAHDEDTTLWLTDNHQDMSVIADALAKRWQISPLQWGLLVRGHGIYAWGETLHEARQHIEAIDFLLNCDLEMRRLGQ